MARARGKAVDTTPKTKSDAYTGMLLVSLIAMIVGSVFLFLDYSSYPETKPPQKVQEYSPPKGGGTPAPAPPGGAPGGVQG